MNAQNPTRTRAIEQGYADEETASTRRRAHRKMRATLCRDARLNSVPVETMVTPQEIFQKYLRDRTLHLNKNMEVLL